VRLAAAAAVVLAALVTAASAFGACAKPKVSLAKLEGEVMCPICHTTLDQSDSLAAQQIEQFIAVRIARCESEAQIKRELIENYGTVILAAPPRKGFDLLAWWLPLGGILAAAVLVGFGAWRWRRARAAEAEPEEELDPETERRLDDLLAHYE
jgi:cytochrome c-type biogenesis protein CcmH